MEKGEGSHAHSRDPVSGHEGCATRRGRPGARARPFGVSMGNLLDGESCPWLHTSLLRRPMRLPLRRGVWSRWKQSSCNRLRESREVDSRTDSRCAAIDSLSSRRHISLPEFPSWQAPSLVAILLVRRRAFVICGQGNRSYAYVESLWSASTLK